MKIQLLSDLHLERDPRFQARRAPGADVLVLAGDIGSYQGGSRLAEDDFGLGRYAPGEGPDAWPTVIYVPGNHEYDALEFDATHARLRELCERLGIVWLERTTHVLQTAAGPVRFVGTTLWSDFDAFATEGSETQRLKQRDKALRAADFYLRKNTTLRNGQPQLAEAMREQALLCQAWLRETLAQPFEAGPTIVVTHFAPSLRSADPRYGLKPGTAGFCNALDDLLPRADLWLHGHLHCRHDYVAEGRHADGRRWRCRVVANPLGYALNGEQDGFDPLRTIELASGPADMADT